MKKLLVVVLAVLVIASFSFAQKWVFDSDFATGASPHGVVVDNDGKIWVGHYGPADTLFLANGDTVAINPLRCYNPDGTQTSFSPICVFTNGSDINDTLDWDQPYSCRGIALDHNGNILYSGSKGQLYRINALTGEAMNKIITPTAASLTQAAVDAEGYIFIGHVGGGNPCYIFDEDFELYAYAVDTVNGLQRSILVTPDGKDIYMGKIYTSGYGITHYHSDDGVDGEYILLDTLYYSQVAPQLWAQCINWDNNGLLWVGTYWDVGLGSYTAWYALDPTQNFVVIDTVGHNVGETPAAGVNLPPVGGTYFAPRGAAWSTDGKTMYTADFDGSIVKKWTNAAPVGPGAPEITVGIDYEGETPVIVVDFTLSQNYPNPFNPTTMIPFDIENGNHVKLIVYDMLGHEVKTLVNENLNPGHHEYRFDATGFATGMYIYRLEINGQMMAKRMLYVK